MKNEIITIDTLQWRPYTTGSQYECTSITFQNNYGVSIISWGGTYELCTLYFEEPINHEITDNNVKVVKTHDEVNEILKQIQELK